MVVLTQSHNLQHMVEQVAFEKIKKPTLVIHPFLPVNTYFSLATFLHPAMCDDQNTAEVTSGDNTKVVEFLATNILKSQKHVCCSKDDRYKCLIQNKDLNFNI